MANVWSPVKAEEEGLCQGDLLRACAVPILKAGFEVKEEITLRTQDLLVMSQTCDLVQGRLKMVTLAPICTVAAFEEGNPKIAGQWQAVAKSRFEGLSVLGPTTASTRFSDCLVADFHEIFSLPFEYLLYIAAKHEKPRYRLLSPYLEHVSQTFARFYMRVALPDNSLPEIPKRIQAVVTGAVVQHDPG